MRETIVHLIYCRSFVDEYISFMLSNFEEYEHVFVCERTGSEDKLRLKDKVHFVDDYREIGYNAESCLGAKLASAKKIIISGFFSGPVYKFVARMPRSMIRKVYIQFWGGDFYGDRTPIPWNKINKKAFFALKKLCIIRAKGIITLIPEDYDEFVRIMHLTKKRHFVAQMPEQHDTFEGLVFDEPSHERINVVAGNSASVTNCHLEIFRQLAALRDEIEVYCPLSYGDAAYAEEVSAAGRDIFGTHFHPMLDFVPKDAYIRWLNTMDVGVFANDRQQALGNIFYLMRLKKKVYLRKGTSMWNNFVNTKKVTVYDFMTIPQLDASAFRSIPQRVADENAVRIKDFIYGPERIEQWKRIFED